MSKRRVAGIVITVVVGLIVLIVLIQAGASVAWTGFGMVQYKKPQGAEVEPAKTLWDWLSLLIVPVLLALGGYWFNQQRTRTENRIALNRQREDALQRYFDNLTELLLGHQLLMSEENALIRNIAQARTVAALRGLDRVRQGILAQFLRASGLETTLSDADLSEVNLSGVDLREVNLCRADLSGADLSGANLIRANLSGANLSEAKLGGAILTVANLRESILSGAVLRGADLTVANLSGAVLTGADLREANLCWAVLDEANLSGADLRKADLTGTEVNDEQLAQAISLEGAIVSNGVEHD